MVNATEGVLVECADAAMKQLLLHLDEKLPPDKKFILHDLDETHVFIASKHLEFLQSEIDCFMDSVSFPLAEKD
ncbi:hypothetical protein DAPPUDRAFT_328340 [Daphnia pulex]|uniref:General transcription and DNA repair factor IIH subunit TFB5 n=1 Tax=Daphnia pulex TaxID=6669 RepID=E9HCW2_DAPPU|nr:hypothetical protein DAPPUDRAFT_328340 [Daphnia pulex]|eukprot:EFX70423.1 hypothetical protein DAPPUDRAFT_328340 [Daphnia pulex]